MLRRSVLLHTLFVWLCASVTLSACRAAPAETPSSFYQRHPITIIVFSEAGSTYDTYARLLARHLADHVAGRADANRARADVELVTAQEVEDLLKTAVESPKPVIDRLKAALGRT